MSRYYSPSTKGFYSNAYAGSKPDDAIEIAEDVYEDLLSGVNSGKVIAIVEGYPQLRDRPPTASTPEQLRAYAMQKADSLLGALRTYSAGAITVQSDASAATLASWFALSQWSLANPSGKTVWVASDGSTAALNAAAIQAIAPLVCDLPQQVYPALAAVITKIATSKITTIAAIDAAAWPGAGA